VLGQQLRQFDRVLAAGGLGRERGGRESVVVEQFSEPRDRGQRRRLE
jgi:hypothetical protein